MKTISTFTFSAILTTGLLLRAADPPSGAPANPPAPPGNTNPVPIQPITALTNTPTPAVLNTNPPIPAVLNPTNAPGEFPVDTNAVSVQPASSVVVVTNAPALPVVPYNPVDGLRLNFRGVPLEMVLNYLSDAAGFIIVLETRVEGNVDVWSNQPLTKDEAVSLLNTVLNKNGYAAIRNGRILTIVPRDTANKRDIPVKRGSDPDEIPKSDEIITQIIPVRYVNATQLTKDLQPLLPLQATMTANEAGNALVITDSQTNIRRVAEIVKALDTSFSSVSAIRVYLLKYADAKTVVTVVRDLFAGQDSGRSSQDMRAQFFQRMRFGRGGGPSEGGNEGGPAGTPGSGRAPTPKVIATSDDRSNALVVSAPDEVIPTIDDLVKAIDTEVEDVTEVRVFHLKYADPYEMADLLAGLFPDDTRSDTSSRRVRFGGFGGRFGGFAGGAQSSTSQESDRMKRMGRVLAVPDPRTASVVVSASRDLMVQIAQMVEQLDSDPAKKQKVYVYSLENADVTEVEQLLRDMFDRNGTMNNRNTANQRNALNSRSQQNSQNPNRSSGIGTGMGSRGTGGGMGSGFGTGF